MALKLLQKHPSLAVLDRHAIYKPLCEAHSRDGLHFDAVANLQEFAIAMAIFDLDRPGR